VTAERITRLNPPTLHDTPGYHHVTTVESGRMAYLAGQCPVDRSGSVVGADVPAQVDQATANAALALAAVGATPGDVVRAVIYVVTDDRSELAAAWTRCRASAIADAFTTASTLLGVAMLGYPGQLVEIDLTVALPD
jgi:enamine deaminase RidA (YjgF/YER057c/UK114 family)